MPYSYFIGSKGLPATSQLDYGWLRYLECGDDRYVRR
jgi:hypothetical protein